MRVRIVNDGEPGYMTKLTDAETGAPIERATDATITVDFSVRDIPRAYITTICPRVDVVADAQMHEVCPHCGKATTIEPELPAHLELALAATVQKVINATIAEYMRVKASDLGDVTDYPSTRHPAYDL